MSTVDTYTVNCPVTTTTSTTTSYPTYYTYYVKLDNSTGNVCYAYPTTVYSSSILLTTGDTIYYDTSLNNPVTGYDYMSRASGDPTIYELNPGTGVLLNSYGSC